MSTVTKPITYDYPRTPLKGKGVVVSGGTTGIGRATAVALANQGADVLIFGRTKEHLEDALEDLRTVSNGSGVHGLTADQSKPEDVQRVFEEAMERLGGVDILINNAAVPGESLEDSSEDWEYIMSSNLLGCMACCEAAIPIMKHRGGGQIVNVGSLSAKSKSKGSDIYVATKSGLRGFTESLGKGLVEDNIRVIMIEPGKVSTDFFDWSPEEREKRVREKTAMKSEDIAECILFALTMPARCHLTMLQVKPLNEED
jgi:NADP-dependent 3-hydroxy acid dehydrogenase YdfG